MDTCSFDYETFDRQMLNLLLVSRAFVSGRCDSGTMELNLDLRSLCEKSSRLCYLADLDIALQHEDILHHRRQKNLAYLTEIGDFVKNHLAPMILNAVGDARSGKGFVGIKSPEFPVDLPTLLPRLSSIIKDDSDNDDKWNMMLQNVDEVDEFIVKNVKPTIMPGMHDVERLWMLLQYYTLMCYLMFHFQRAVDCCSEELSADDIERMFTSAVLRYQNSEEGRAELARYYEVLLFKENKRAFAAGELDHFRKTLVNDVPQRFQLMFVKDIDSDKAFANDFYALGPTMEEYAAVMPIVAKYQMLSHKMYELQHPERVKPSIYNEVFYTVVKGQPVDMTVLRERIRRMLRYVDRKNHWFCVWCVLKHHNLIENFTFEAFARQMMNPDWFGRDVEESLRIKGDNLRDYVGYLSYTDYTHWDYAAYNNWRDSHNKKKLSTDLSDKFMRICMDMDEEFGGE